MGLSEIQLSDVPAWIGMISLPLAFLIFAREQRDRARGQIDGLGVWATASYPREAPGTSTGNKAAAIMIHFRNAGDLPLRITRVAWRIESKWMVRDKNQSADSISVWIPTPGTSPQLIFYENVLVAPQDTVEFPVSVDVTHTAPPGSLATQPDRWHHR